MLLVNALYVPRPVLGLLLLVHRRCTTRSGTGRGAYGVVPSSSGNVGVQAKSGTSHCLLPLLLFMPPIAGAQPIMADPAAAEGVGVQGKSRTIYLLLLLLLLLFFMPSAAAEAVGVRGQNITSHCDCCCWCTHKHVLLSSCG